MNLSVFFPTPCKKGSSGKRQRGEVGDRDFEGSIHLTAPVHGGRDGVGRQLGEGIPEP